MRPSVLKTRQYAIAGFGLLCMLVVQTCQTLPDDLQRTNPLDVNNPVTHGDPFHLRARIAQGGVLLEWDAPAMGGIQSYVVYRQMNEAGPYAQRLAVPVSQTSYVDTVSNGHTYRWRVVAMGPGGESSLSNVVSVKIDTDPLVAIAGGAEYTPTREVEVTLIAGIAVRMKLFTDTTVIYMPWVPFQASSQVTLPEGPGEKHVYVMVQYPDSMVSAVVSDVIMPRPIDLLAFSIQPVDSEYINYSVVTLSVSDVGATLVKLARVPDSTGTIWQSCTTQPPVFDLGAGDGLKHVYAWFRNDWFESGMATDSIWLDTYCGIDTFFWTSTVGDTLLYGDTLWFFLRMRSDSVHSDSVERGGRATASLAGNFVTDAFTDIWDGSYTGWRVLNSHADFDERYIALQFTDRAGNSSTTQSAIPIAYRRQPFEVGYCNAASYAVDVAVAGNYAFVAASGAGLWVVDITHPSEPFETGSCYTGLAQGVAVWGNCAYVANLYSGLCVVDITNPAAPFEVGRCDTADSARDVTVSGGYAYVAAELAGLWIMDVTNPLAPFGAGFYDPPGSALGVAVSGTYAYVAGAGLRVVTITNPAAPSEVGSCDIVGNACGVAVSGNYAYVATQYGGLRVVNISNPSAPTEVGFCDTPGNVYGVAVSGNYAYVADAGSGLRVVNIRDPSHPVEVGFCDTPGYSRSVAVSGKYAYVADAGGGLRVIRVPR